jgi:hypothetical protein
METKLPTKNRTKRGKKMICLFVVSISLQQNQLIRYYDDAACILRKMFLDAKAPHLSSTAPPILPWKENEPIQPPQGITRQGSLSIIGAFGQSEELRCVIAVIRQ